VLNGTHTFECLCFILCVFLGFVFCECFGDSLVILRILFCLLLLVALGLFLYEPDTKQSLQNDLCCFKSVINIALLVIVTF